MFKRKVNYLIILAATAILAATSFFATSAIGTVYYEKANPAINSDPIFQQKISQETDAVSTSKLGLAFIRADRDDLAKLAFEKATELDPKWRDAWLYRGYLELKANDPQTALSSLEKAKQIDSVYPLLYQLYTSAYNALGDTAKAEQAKEKFATLNK